MNYYSVSQFVVGLAEKDSEKTYLNEHRISCIRNEIHVVESRSLNGMDTTTTNERKMFFQREIYSNDFIDHPHSSVSSLTCFFACFTPKNIFFFKRTEVGHGNIYKHKNWERFYLSNVFLTFVGKLAQHLLLAKKNVDVSLTSFASIIVGVR